MSSDVNDLPPAATRDACLAMDERDTLAAHREAFSIPPGLIYLDGNSLGPLPVATRRRLREVVDDEWGRGLIASWNSAGWIDAPARVGDKIARLIGAAPGQVVAADSTSINLYKVLSAALKLRPDRRVIVSERGNFPTDLYIAQGLIAQLDAGHTLRLVERDALDGAIDDSVAAVMLTQVDYRTGHRLPMASVTARAHAAGALMIWDLAHSAGAFPVALDDAHADFAIGCSYKYLNGGPGATAFLYVAARHQQSFLQPLTGWLGHAAPFAFETGYRPADGIGRALCGTPPILSLSAAECGVDTLLATLPDGGLAALHAKACSLIDVFVSVALAGGARHGLRCVTPAAPADRGSQASFVLPDGDQAHAVVQALIAEGVVGDFRAPDILRFGFAPLYLRHVDAYDAATRLVDILETGRWREPRFLARKAVT
ncbi:MAG: kynureninase [Burkholderiaceae bacterium]